MTFPPPVRAYVVGGAVRDRLLGLPVQDRDHVVVGASAELMASLGFRPVGKDFPVFLHPVTQEEYALARTERKTAPGYRGFVVHAAPDVSLEEDLLRRDLTINAMAEDEDGRIIDPHGGQADIAARTLRHVSDAFVEDPVRILRVARFSARFPDFSVAPETLALMARMVADGEVDALVPERVWQELSRGLMARRPARMIQVLRDCGALARLLPEVDRLFGVPQNPISHPEMDTGLHLLAVLDQAALADADLPVRYAALLHDLGKGLTPRERWPDHSGHEERGMAAVDAVNERLRVPADCAGLARVVSRWHGRAHAAKSLDAEGMLHLLEQTDALRRPARFAAFLQACQADFRGRPGYESRPFLPADRLHRALEAARNVPAGAIASQAPDPGAIPGLIHAARVAAIQEALPP
ncbi:MAG: multifunctional CCA addition/repair protein [Pseudomonadota bacterium]